MRRDAAPAGAFRSATVVLRAANHKYCMIAGGNHTILY